jgi:hypothetical protein
MNVEIGTETPIFLFWEYLFQNFGILSMQCMLFRISGNFIHVEKPAETQTSIRLASHLVRAPNSRSGGRKFESLIRRELGAGLKVKYPWGQVFLHTHIKT